MGCEGYHLSRRHFVQAGVAGMATLLGMPVRALRAAPPEVPASAAAVRRATADHVILLWMGGGMSHIDTLDPKPGRATGGDFKPIATTASGVEISEILPTVAQQMKHCTLVRSIAGTEGDHDRATYQLNTSYKRSPQFIHPGIGSICAHELEAQGDLPSFISIGGRSVSAGYLGQSCEAYYIGQPGQPDPYLHLPQGVSQGRAQRRMEALASFNQQFAAQHGQTVLKDTDATYATAQSFMRSPALQAFELQREPESVREAYGDSNFGRGCLLARRLVQQGVRFVQVTHGGWDTHENNFPALRRQGETIDPGIGALIGDLAATGMLERTMVILLSEFGRTPQINQTAGRDHHPGVFSTLMAGGGLRRGIVYGSSDADGRMPQDQPIQVPDIHATVVQALGADPDKWVQTPIGRPMRLVDQGKPVAGLLARTA